MITKAMILAAGFGKRLLPLTQNCPKPLLKIGEETLLSNTLKFLKSFGIKEVIINVHYLGKKIIDYVNKNKFDLNITVVEEKGKILDTGGGVSNVIEHFLQEPFIIINPDTIWNHNFLNDLKLMERNILKDRKIKCLILMASKEKSFDPSFKGDFNLKNKKVNRNKKDSLKYIYTGLQIIKSEVFKNFKTSTFSMNKIWDNLIQNDELNGVVCSNNFFHVSSLEIYKKLIDKNFTH